MRKAGISQTFSQALNLYVEGWGTQVIIYGMTLIVTLIVALVADLGFRTPLDRVVPLTILLTLALLVLVPSFIIKSRAKSAGHGINDLRAHISGLKINGSGKRQTTLEPAVRRFAEQFSEATGILVEVEFDHEKLLHVNDRLTAEVFQMIAEGLSNIRRHTQSACARITIGYDSGKLHLEIENDLKADSTVSFAPRSLTERAAALGGAISVKQKPPGSTVVEIEIPL